jgi:hypothetical protein
MIVMVYDHQTSSYVPVVYILLTHKNSDMYFHAFQTLVNISEWKLEPKNYCSDFEQALMSELDRSFGNYGQHHGCFFHFKQAIRRYMTKKLKMSSEIVTRSMEKGMIDLLIIIPINEIESKGIPYVRSLLEVNATASEKKQWNDFWQYFNKQWMPIVAAWNIESKDGGYKDLVSKTNNGLERYNRKVNEIFPTRPDLEKFCVVLKKEVIDVAQNVNDIRTGRSRKPRREECQIPELSSDYVNFIP